MATARADAWEQSDLRTERPPLARSDRRPPPPLPPLPELPGRGRPPRTSSSGPRDRSAERLRPDRVRPVDRAAAGRSRADRALREDVDRARPPRPRTPALPPRPLGPDSALPVRDSALPVHDDVRAARATRPAAPPARATGDTPGSRLRGTVAVLGMFLVTLAGAAIDSFFGSGLGLVTLVLLVTSTAVAGLLVQRRDMISVVLAPPLLFPAVAGISIALAPSVSLNLPTVASLMIRGFPTMAVATVAAVVVCLVRRATRR